MHWCVSARIGSVTIVKKKIDANDCQYKLKYWQKRFGKEEVDFVITTLLLYYYIELSNNDMCDNGVRRKV